MGDLTRLWSRGPAHFPFVRKLGRRCEQIRIRPIGILMPSASPLTAALAAAGPASKCASFPTRHVALTALRAVNARWRSSLYINSRPREGGPPRRRLTLRGGPPRTVDLENEVRREGGSPFGIFELENLNIFFV